MIKLDEISKRVGRKKLIYSGDTRICDNLVKLAQDADILYDPPGVMPPPPPFEA